MDVSFTKGHRIQRRNIEATMLWKRTINLDERRVSDWKSEERDGKRKH